MPCEHRVEERGRGYEDGIKVWPDEPVTLGESSVGDTPGLVRRRQRRGDEMHGAVPEGLRERDAEEIGFDFTNHSEQSKVREILHP